MNVNDLVYHKRNKTKGIGCITKVLKNKVKVNFGLDGVFTQNPADLQIIDTSKTKTMPFDNFRRMTLTNSKKLPSELIIGNEVRHYVGIGWVPVRVVTEEDLKKLTRVI